MFEIHNLTILLEFITQCELEDDSEEWYEAYKRLKTILYACNEITNVSVYELINKLDNIVRGE